MNLQTIFFIVLIAVNAGIVIWNLITELVSIKYLKKEIKDIKKDVHDLYQKYDAMSEKFNKQIGYLTGRLNNK